MIDDQVLSVTTPTEREIVLRRIFDAPRRLVFEAWTNPAYVPRWMMGPGGWTMPICEIDLRSGGKWRYVWRKPDGAEMEMQGVYQEITPPERLIWTESWGGSGPETLSTVVLSEDSQKTTMTFTKLYPSREARDAALKSGIKEGVTASFTNLAKLLASLDSDAKEKGATEV